ncbi:MAG: 50S ribosomal protein L25/general stress protein Ctc [Brachymonas sp.]|uniref:50S ribosomal protein L25/general stress protein Ctc n=1 Tax=unclassified Brachymonas TaxID=2621329 RepID=UPI0035B0EFDA
MKVVAFERAKQGTGASRRLRNAGKTPGIVYGGEAAPQMIELDHNALWHALKKEAFHASLLELQVGDQTSRVLLRDVQYHPYKQLVLHVDFQRVSATQKLHIKVPLHFTGVEESPAIKEAQCLINHVTTELEISCLPADLPEFIAVDLSKLAVGESIHLSSITLPNGVTAVLHGDEDLVLVTATAPKANAEDEAEAAAPAADAAPAAPAAE